MRSLANLNSASNIFTSVRQGCIMSSWVLSVYMDSVVKRVKMGMGRMGVRFLKEGREWRQPLV